MFEAYKVAVKLSLIENVTAGLMSMSSAFSKAHGDAAMLQNRLDRLKMPTLVGGAMFGAGAIGLHSLLKHPIDEAVRYQNIMGTLSAQGVGDMAIRQADKFAHSNKIMGASMSDTLKMVTEANSVLRDMGEAQAVTPLLMKMKVGIESYMGLHGHGSGHGAQAEQMFMAALKTTELRGALVDPATGHFSEDRFKNTLDFMTKAYTASGGLVKPTEYLNMIKTGGIAAKSLSDNSFYFGLMHMMQEQGGSRTGTGLMSAFQNMYMGRTTQQVADEMQKMGILTADKIHYGKTGHITKVDPAALKNADLFRTDQFAYMQQVMLPMIRAKGIKDGQDMEMEIAKLFSNRVGGSQWVTMYKERANIQKHMDAAKDAMGIDSLYGQRIKQYDGQKEALGKKWNDLMLTLGERILPTAIKALEWLNPLLTKTVNFLQQHGTVTKYLIGAFAGLSILAVVAGGVVLLGVAIGALQIFLAGGALSAGLGAMATGIRLFAGAAMFGLRGLASVIMLLGRALLMNPIGLVITGISLAIYGLYTYWDKIKSWLPKWMTGGDESHGASGSFGKVDAVRSSQQAVHVTVNNTVDERGVTSMVTRNQSKAADRPQSGNSGYDGKMGIMFPTIAGG